MATDQGKPQTERIRELILTGDLEQLKGLIEFEAGLSRDDTLRPPKRIGLTLFGPIAHGASLCRLVHNGCHAVLSGYRLWPTSTSAIPTCWTSSVAKRRASWLGWCDAALPGSMTG